ncbi:MAG: hypothetical protein Q7K39_00820 [Candidatus Magasanikbacteria bacterium]|nr:hypothetical protein [Candidatus Magasanikbacteria bacterium]
MSEANISDRPAPIEGHAFTHDLESGPHAGLMKALNHLWSATKDHGGFSISPDKIVTLDDSAAVSGITISIARAIENFLPDLSAEELAGFIKYIAELHKHPSRDHE